MIIVSNPDVYEFDPWFDLGSNSYCMCLGCKHKSSWHKPLPCSIILRWKLTTGHGGEGFVPDPTGNSVLRYGLVLSFCAEEVGGPFYMYIKRTQSEPESRRVGGMEDGEIIGEVRVHH